MTHDSEYCRSRAARALAAASHKGESEEARIAGDLALAYSTLAKRRRAVEARARSASGLDTAEPRIILVQD